MSLEGAILPVRNLLFTNHFLERLLMAGYCPLTILLPPAHCSFSKKRI